MKKQHIPRVLGGGAKPAIVEALARKSPQTVKDLADELRLSYMGVKAQCQALERSAYLKSSRRRSKRGRPEVLYSLTARARTLFPDRSAAFATSLLEHCEKLFGKQAPQKLLYQFFRSAANAYADSIALCSPRQRLRMFVDMRAREGRFSRLEEKASPMVIIETHNPLAVIFAEYPEAADYETDTLSAALGMALKREDSADGTTTFTLPNIPIEPKQFSSPRPKKNRTKSKDFADLPLFA